MYGPGDVRRLQKAVARNLTVPHRFVVMTDDVASFANDANITALPLPLATHIPNTCFVRLFTFAPEAKAILGDRVLRIDLDTIVVGNLDSLVRRNEDLVMWRNPTRWWMEGRGEIANETKYGFWCGGLLLHRTGTMPHLWSQFDPKNPQAKDDDHYLSDVIGSSCAYWDQMDGVYRYITNDAWRLSGVVTALPDNAKIVFFPGTEKPWLSSVIARAPWITKYMDASDISSKQRDDPRTGRPRGVDYSVGCRIAQDVVNRMDAVNVYDVAVVIACLVTTISQLSSNNMRRISRDDIFSEVCRIMDSGVIGVRTELVEVPRDMWR